MSYVAVLMAFLSGALGMYSLVTWQQSIHDWRGDAWLAAGGLTAAVLLAWLA